MCSQRCREFPGNSFRETTISSGRVHRGGRCDVSQILLPITVGREDRAGKIESRGNYVITYRVVDVALFQAAKLLEASGRARDRYIRPQERRG